MAARGGRGDGGAVAQGAQGVGTTVFRPHSHRFLGTQLPFFGGAEIEKQACLPAQTPIFKTRNVTDARGRAQPGRKRALSGRAFRVEWQCAPAVPVRRQRLAGGAGATDSRARLPPGFFHLPTSSVRCLCSRHRSSRKRPMLATCARACRISRTGFIGFAPIIRWERRPHPGTAGAP